MTRDDVIKLAREAGLLIPSFRIDGGLALGACTVPDFERFASLVAAAERERLAIAIENSMDQFRNNSDWANGYIQATEDIKDGIRARGDA